MIHKWLEEGYDTLLFLLVLVGSLLFFILYWKDEYQVRFAEIVMNEFLLEVAVDGKITLEDQEKLIQNLKKVNPQYEVEIRCTEYTVQPVYAQIPENMLRDYYMSRNIRKENVFLEHEVIIKEEDAGLLQLQRETNATILAAAQKDFISLPGEVKECMVEAVRPVQEVYVGEPLITLCRVESEKGSYYVEVEPVLAAASGTVLLQPVVEGKQYSVPIEVVCHPRTVVCRNGHEIVNSVKILTESRERGVIVCPFCEVLPVEIICNTNVISRKTGAGLTEQELWVTVIFMDGHEETLSSDAAEWQDSYDENYCGIQRVTIFYRGAEAEVTVISENEVCQQCNGDCNERYYTDYAAFPYCIECMSKVMLFTGRIYEEEQWTSTAELTYWLDKEKEKCLKRGDFVVLYLSEHGRPVTVLQKKVLQSGKQR